MNEWEFCLYVHIYYVHAVPMGLKEVAASSGVNDVSGIVWVLEIKPWSYVQQVLLTKEPCLWPNFTLLSE